jgi:hypothetical protein
MQNIVEIIKSIDSPFLGKIPNINPTVIYNEGWMTRLLVCQSVQEGLTLEKIDFATVSNWTSEVLISSPFVDTEKYREGYTHADIALGDIDVDYTKRGEIEIRSDAKLFGIIEAKMGSNLSQGTTHVPGYNQASRNLACIAKNTYLKPDCQIFFYVVAPDIVIEKHKINAQIELNIVIPQIKRRFDLYPINDKVRKHMDLIISRASTCNIKSISYENWMSIIKDQNARNYLQNFYTKAKKWNRI